MFAAGLTARLRGFPLKGSRMKVPEGYSGVVLKEAQAVEAGDGGRVVRGVARFDTFTFWNWDRQPSRSDKYQQALDWLEVASVVSGGQIGLWCVWRGREPYFPLIKDFCVLVCGRKFTYSLIQKLTLKEKKIFLYEDK